MTELVVADVGGTHARFALASLPAEGAITLGEPVTLRTGDYDGFEAAWADFSRLAGCRLPRALAIAAAGPLIDGGIKLTNASWRLQLDLLRINLGLEAITALNDFAAVAHAVARVPGEQLIHISGPERSLPEEGTITVIGPGTGLGVAQVHRKGDGYYVQATEGGHFGFAPQDQLDDAILSSLRTRYARVVTEHVVAGPGIAAIYGALGGSVLSDERDIWAQGIAGNDPVAQRAVDRFCASLGSVAGDFALAQGASGVVLAGGIGLRLREVLLRSEFAAWFCNKPRYEGLMATLPVKLIVHPQPGLYGAAAAFQLEHLA